MDKLTKEFDNTITADLTQVCEEDFGNILLDASKDAGEILKSDLLNEIPFIRYIFSGLKAFKDISNLLLIKKIIKFLLQLNDIPQQDRMDFMGKLDSKDREEIISSLILILDKLESLQKSEILGKILKSYIREKINKEEFFSLMHSIMIIDIKEIDFLRIYYTSSSAVELAKVTENKLYNFVFLQLITIDNSKIGLMEATGPLYKLNHLGKLIVEIVYDLEIPAPSVKFRLN